MWMIVLFDLFVLPEKYNTRCTLDLPCSIAVRIIVSLLKITTFPEHKFHPQIYWKPRSSECTWTRQTT